MMILLIGDVRVTPVQATGFFPETAGRLIDSGIPPVIMEHARHKGKMWCFNNKGFDYTDRVFVLRSRYLQDRKSMDDDVHYWKTLARVASVAEYQIAPEEKYHGFMDVEVWHLADDYLNELWKTSPAMKKCRKTLLKVVPA